MESTLIAVQTAFGARGSLDHASASEQMCAVDYALRNYFEAEDWLEQRDERIPTLRRR